MSGDRTLGELVERQGREAIRQRIADAPADVYVCPMPYCRSLSLTPGKCCNTPEHYTTGCATYGARGGIERVRYTRHDR